MSAKPLAAVGIRVSEVAGRALGGRSGRRTYTDDDQSEKGLAMCADFKLEPAFEFEEMDTSGTLPLERRPKLLDALERMERGEIKAIVFPYRDRQDRSIETMTDLVRRVDAVDGLLIAGGSVITHKTADAWARSVLESFSNEMPSRLAREKVRSAHERAVADGIPPYAPVPGYVKGEDGRFYVVDELKPIIREAFAMRDRQQPASINTIRRFLREHGIVRSYAGVESMLRSETYIGNIAFGKGKATELRNDGAFEGIVDPDVWHRVQAKKGTRGRQARSERLLARQGVLRCGTCDSRMTATTSNGHAFYRCQHNASPNCTARATISAERVEALVVAKLKALREVQRLEGTASTNLGEQYHQAAKRAKDTYKAAIRMFGEDDDLVEAEQKIAELKDRWQALEREAEAYGRTEGARKAIRLVDDWDEIDLDLQRVVIRAAVERIDVAPVDGRGLSGAQWDESRVDVQFFDQGTTGSLV